MATSRSGYSSGANSPWPSDQETLGLPRILCLHGGGVSGDIFELQCRSIIRALGRTFRFVFVNGPYMSNPHPDIISVFGDHGPFYRWLRWAGDEGLAHDASARVRRKLEDAMRRDKGRGPWVGLLGFSQGAKIAASLLWAGERGVVLAGADQPFRFAVVMNGSAPIIDLRPKAEAEATPHVADPESLDFDDWPSGNDGDHVVLRTPSLHVHGLRDPGLAAHRALYKLYFREDTASLFEWDGEHRIPITSDVVEGLVAEIKALAVKTGVAI
jgi:predicted esterase